MGAYWVTFVTNRKMCIEGKDEAAVRERALPIGEVSKIERLPYPAEPRLEPHEEFTMTNGTKVSCPSFCLQPSLCVGRGSCPRRYACSE